MDPHGPMAPWTGEGRATQEQLPSLHAVNEHFELIFDAVIKLLRIRTIRRNRI